MLLTGSNQGSQNSGPVQKTSSLAEQIPFRFPGSRQVSCVTPHAIQHGPGGTPSRNLAFQALKADFFGLLRHATGTPARPVRTHPDNPSSHRLPGVFRDYPIGFPLNAESASSCCSWCDCSGLAVITAAQRPNRLSAHTLNRLPVSCCWLTKIDGLNIPCLVRGVFSPWTIVF